MIRNYKRENEVRGRILKNSSIKAMLNIIGINNYSDIKLSRRGYAYCIVRGNSYTSKNENLFIEECKKGYVKNNGNGNYSLTHKGKKYIELATELIILDNNRFIPDF